MGEIKAVIFDMDGVLIDAKDWHYLALNRALGLFGLEISRHDHLVTYDGLPTKKKLKMLTVERGLPEALHSFINEMKQIYTTEMVYAHCKPVFFHEFALSRLRNDGYRIAVASNSIRSTVKTMMEKSKLVSYLDFYLSNEDVSNSKPHPEIYELAISNLKLEPKECLIVEDNPNGIRAARASGAHVLEVGRIEEVNYGRITNFIKTLEEGAC